MDFINEGKTGKVKLYDIYEAIYEDCDSALADDFYKGLKPKMNQKKNIDLADAEVQLYIRDFLESHENDYQYDLLKQALEPYYDHEYDLADEDVQESYEVLEEDEYLDENATFEEIIYRMECAEIYEDLYNAAMLIVDPKLQNMVTHAIQQCEDDGDDVEEAYSIVTSDLLDMHVNDKNEEFLTEDIDENKNSILSKVFAQYPDINEEDEDYLNGLSYDELVNELKNRGWDDLLEESEEIKTEVKKTLDDVYSDSATESLWDEKFNELVPKEGKANTDIGEIMRCFASMSHAYLQNGEIIQNMQRSYLEDVIDLDKVLKRFGDQTLITLLDKMDLTRSKSAYDHYMAEFYEYFVNTYLKDNKEVKEESIYDNILDDYRDFCLDNDYEITDSDAITEFCQEVAYHKDKESADNARKEIIKYINSLEESKKEESKENPQEFQYRMLARLKSDCDYYLGNGNRDAEHALWAKNEEGQIAEMRKLYNQLKEKPEWLSEEDINNYAKEMGVVDLPSTVDGTAEEEIQDTLDRLEKREKEGLTEAEDMEAVKDEIETAKEETENTDQEIEQVQGSIDVLKTDEESAIDGYDTFIEDTKEVVDPGLADAIEDQVEEIKTDEEEHIEKLDTIKNALDEAKGQAPDFKVDFEGDMTIDMGYTDEEGAEKRAKELIGDVAKSTNVRDLNVDVKDVKKIEKENKELTEDKNTFSGIDFEKNIPHVMRWKEYSKVNENDLYWVTQQFFTEDDVKKFAEAFKETNFDKAYVTVRDLSTYQFDVDSKRNVLVIINKDGTYDMSGYINACKEDGYDTDLYESKELKKENKVIWTSEYQGDEETAEQAYQEYTDEFEPSTKTPVSFEEWLEDTKDTWFDAEANRYKEEHPGEIDKLSDFEIDEIDAQLRDNVEKEIEANIDDLKEQYEEYCEEIKQEMTSPEDKERWLTGWYEQDAQAQWEVVDEDFSDNIWPMIETQCNEDILILLGSLGRWNGTFDGGKIIYADEQNLRNTMSDYDEISVEADDENKLSINYMHHDGTDTMYLYTIPQDLTELAKAMNYEDPDELDTDIRQDYVDMEELAKHVDLLIPIINKGRGNV